MSTVRIACTADAPDPGLNDSEGWNGKSQPNANQIRRMKDHRAEHGGETSSSKGEGWDVGLEEEKPECGRCLTDGKKMVDEGKDASEAAKGLGDVCR
jgi:hypothetical protein